MISGMRTLYRYSAIFISTVLLIVVFFAGVYIGSNNIATSAQTTVVDSEQANPITLPPANADQDFAAFWQVYNLIKKNYIDAPDDEVLINGAIDGLIGALNDQFSGYITPELFGTMDDLSGEIQGIGVVIGLIEERNLIEIVNVLRGTPAEAAGLREGDIFIEVNGEDVRGMNTSELAARVRGPEGTIVNIKMLRGEEELEFSIARARISVPNIETDILEGNIGYIKLNQFTAEARRDLDRAMVEIDSDNRDAVILDLRGNPGGLLSSAVNVASAFIETGVVLYEQFGDGTEQVFEANGTYLGYDKPLVILIDERSASGSELVAGAWQDQGVATIIGAKSFGKGTVQTQNQLVNGGGVRLTIARWLTPNRSWIHQEGVTPDIVIEWTIADRAENPEDDPQLQAALDFLKGDVPAVETPDADTPTSDTDSDEAEDQGNGESNEENTDEGADGESSLPFEGTGSFGDLPRLRLEDGGFVVGNPDAPITIVQFIDYLCPACQNYKPTVDRVVEAYVLTGQAKLETRILVTAGGASTYFAGQLGECADDLRPGAFWDAYDILYDMGADQSLRQRNAVEQFAERIGINSAALIECTLTATQVDVDNLLARAVGATGTPGIFVRYGDGDIVPNPYGRNFEALSQAIEEAQQ